MWVFASNTDNPNDDMTKDEDGGEQPMSLTTLDEHGMCVPAHLTMDTRTLVWDVTNNRQLMWIDGVIMPPIGTVLELAEPNVDARVVGIRLGAVDENHPLTVTVDVNVPRTSM